MTETPDHLRLVEALLFAASEPLDVASIAARLPEDVPAEPLLAELAEHYASRGVNVVRIGDKWALRTAPDLGPRLRLERPVARRLSRAAVETLAIIAYHQPVTRAEIEEIRGVALSRGTLELLLEAGWIRPGRRRRTPGRPGTWTTSEAFLAHFGLESLDQLPGAEELRAAGLLERRPVLSAVPGLGGSAPNGGEDHDSDDTGATDDDDSASEVDTVEAASDTGQPAG
jgi:segregation and condensation protein B